MRQRRHSFPCFIRRFSFLFVFPTAGRSIVGGQDKSATPTPPRAIVLGTLHFYFGGASDQSYGQPSVGWTRSLSAYNRAGLLDGCTYRVPVAARQCSDFSSDRWHRDIWSRSRDGPSRHKISHTHTHTHTHTHRHRHRRRHTGTQSQTHALCISASAEVRKSPSTGEYAFRTVRPSAKRSWNLSNQRRGAGQMNEMEQTVWNENKINQSSSDRLCLTESENFTKPDD